MLESVSVSRQTLQQFLDEPFGVPNKDKNAKYVSRYEQYKRENKIRIESAIEFEKSFFVHIKVPSESQKGLASYDVVIQFFTTDERVQREVTVQNYYVQFFSNSPGFVYKYAALYKMEGYLIESLYDKFQPGVLDTLPDKANSKYELYYDSSIYYACKYMIDHKLTKMGKFALRIEKTKPVKTFFRDVQDFESMNVARDVAGIENKLRSEIKKDNQLSIEQERKIKQKNGRIAEHIIKKREAQKAKKDTIKRAVKILPKAKKKASKSTYKKHNS